jgi:hypothetical protein
MFFSCSILECICTPWLVSTTLKTNKFKIYALFVAASCFILIVIPLGPQAASGMRYARLGWPVFGREIFTLKTMMFREITTVLNERKHLKMVIMSVPDAVSLILHSAEQL